LCDQPNSVDEEDGKGGGQQTETPLPMSGVRVERDGRQDRRESGQRNPEENIQRAHVLWRWGSAIKILFVRRSKRGSTAATGKVRLASQEVAPVDQNSLIGGKTLFLHGGR